MARLPTRDHEIGVIAEGVSQVVLGVVSHEPDGKDAQGVDYNRLTALLIEPVKQQQKQIAAAQKQISALKQKATTVESMMTKLQQEREQVELAAAK